MRGNWESTPLGMKVGVVGGEGEGERACAIVLGAGPFIGKVGRAAGVSKEKLWAAS